MVKPIKYITENREYTFQRVFNKPPGMIMNNEDVLHLSDLNLAAFIREMARWNSESEIFEKKDLVLTKGSDHSPVTNVAMYLGNVEGHFGADVFPVSNHFIVRENLVSAFISENMRTQKLNLFVIKKI
jgi:hypothetical protein